LSAVESIATVEPAAAAVGPTPPIAPARAPAVHPTAAVAQPGHAVEPTVTRDDMPTRSAGSAIAASAATTLVPFELPRLNPSTDPATHTAPGSRTKRRPADRAERSSRPDSGGGTGQDAPSRPPVSATAAGGTAAGGGVSWSMWYAILVALLALIGQELRWHHSRPILSGSVGIVVPLRRPG
jgi:hypothetical protein